MDAARKHAGTYLQRVSRWWAGKRPAATAQISRSAGDRRDVACQPLQACRLRLQRTRQVLAVLLPGG
ncbi:hypothetical protein DB811_15240 [Xanthomonas perforans]|uniref:Uncharacterized protein n=1 Tax=Xanthomonas perforans TaxID=442694 RepID=A0AAQ0YRU2_XANPE|nr:hypothetical protein BJD13_21260 [Xanthomonas perforans]AQS77710.1 hypothetical protein XPE_16890 [Xanthomonas perforans 91-118]RXD34097.1 hypothetical protein DB854_18380 [Xanthomonas perforans]RXD40790.1 hypothetical protein DB757_11735 [Xanthomonas perforans]RXD42607.1 hypothetical protein DB761_13945 [Xanthomonas perforans]